MPTYAYACRDCDHRFEAVQSFSDDSLSVCPECDGSLRKVFNSVGIVFKGGGFYRNDSRAASSSSSPASPSSDSGSGSGSGSGDTGKSKDTTSPGSSTGTSSTSAPSTASA
ncbi:FmdB family zinc ribbon protein [Knoellia sp. CPCC 206435]|uniref:FmdB family zinc ribbon protein n=1 Tax=Knoellia terrae TaxID=3404797 RepID=UPI003B4379F2